MEELKTFVIDMTAEEGNKFRLNGEAIDPLYIQSIDIHLEGGMATIETVRRRNMPLAK